MDEERVKRDEGIRGSRVPGVLGRSRRSRLIFLGLPVTLATGALTKKETERQTLSFIVLQGSEEDNRGSEHSVILIVLAGMPQIPIPRRSFTRPPRLHSLLVPVCSPQPRRKPRTRSIIVSFPKIHPTSLDKLPGSFCKMSTDAFNRLIYHPLRGYICV